MHKILIFIFDYTSVQIPFFIQTVMFIIEQDFSNIKFILQSSKLFNAEWNHKFHPLGNGSIRDNYISYSILQITVPVEYAIVFISPIQSSVLCVIQGKVFSFKYLRYFEMISCWLLLLGLLNCEYCLSKRCNTIAV